MKSCLCLITLITIVPALKADWLYVDQNPWVYDLSSQHWMYYLPFYHFSLDFDGNENGYSELLFDPENSELSHRWLYVGYYPYIYDTKEDVWTKTNEYWPLKFACEYIPDGQGGLDPVWISVFDPLGEYLVPDEITTDTGIGLSYFVQAFLTHLVTFYITIHPIEQDGEISLLASPGTSNRKEWANELNWFEKTPATYTKTSDTEAEISLPELGIRIYMNFNHYRGGDFLTYGPDNGIISGSDYGFHMYPAENNGSSLF